MPNWCSNTVGFKADPAQLQEIENLFLQLSARENVENAGQLPDFIEEKNGCFFDINWNDGLLSYDTKWTPNTDVVTLIANHFKAGFVHEYFEPGNMVFGQTIYENGTLTDIYLDFADFNLFDFDEDSEKFVFEDKEYENDLEILEILLDRKKTIKDPNE